METQKGYQEIQGIFDYDILSNQDYQKKFEFNPQFILEKYTILKEGSLV